MKRKVIALTGYIGSGKSTVAGILRQMGYQTVDCDAIARDISHRPETVRAVGKLLGERFVAEGQIDRAAVRQLVFGDEQLLERYQSLFFDGVQRELERVASEGSGPLFVEIAVWDAFPFDWHEVWRVESSRDLLVSRVTARDGVGAASVEATLSRQRTYPVSRVILNNGTPEELRQQVRNALRQAQL